MNAVDLKIKTEIQFSNIEEEQNIANAPNSPVILSGLGHQILHALNQHLPTHDSVVSPPPHSGGIAAAAQGGIKEDAPPAPCLPPGGAPAPVQPSGTLTNANLTGVLDQLEKLLEYISNNPNDPSGPINLMISLMNLGPDALNNPSVKSLLDGWNVMGIIDFAMYMGAESAFFFGYQNSSNNGATGLQEYVTAMLGALGGGTASNPYLAAMYNQLNSFDVATFISNHTNKNGDIGIFVPDKNGIFYDWTNPSAGGDDQYFIEQLTATMEGQAPYSTYFQNLGQNNGIDFAERNYRLTALQQLLAEFQNPEIVITLWIMMAYDQTFQGQEGGLATTTNLLTNITNNYATPLLNFAKQFYQPAPVGAILPPGTLSPSDARTFAQDFMNAENLINILPQTSSFAQNWTDNVYNLIGNTQVTFIKQGATQPTTTTLLNVFTNGDGTYTDTDVATALNSLNQAPFGTDPTTSPAYQSIVNALTQGGALVTGTSKTVSTQISTVSNVDDQVVKLGSSMTSSTGGGFAQLMMQIVQNQISH